MQSVILLFIACGIMIIACNKTNLFYVFSSKFLFKSYAALIMFINMLYYFQWKSLIYQVVSGNKFFLTENLNSSLLFFPEVILIFWSLIIPFIDLDLSILQEVIPSIQHSFNFVQSTWVLNFLSFFSPVVTVPFFLTNIFSFIMYVPIPFH